MLYSIIAHIKKPRMLYCVNNESQYTGERFKLFSGLYINIPNIIGSACDICNLNDDTICYEYLVIPSKKYHKNIHNKSVFNKNVCSHYMNHDEFNTEIKTFEFDDIQKYYIVFMTNSKFVFKKIEDVNNINAKNYLENNDSDIYAFVIYEIFDIEQHYHQ